MDAGLAFREFQLEVIADRRSKPPEDDLVSIAVHAEIDGERLDDESLVQESLLILIGGDETTRHVITDGMLALLAFPDERDRLVADPALMDSGVEELLRYVSPIKNMARTVTRDVEMRGEQLHEGDQLMLFYPSANRDESVFTDPDRLDVGRTPNNHLAFGFGPHFCMGASLARLELKTMFGELFRRLPDLELATDEPLGVPGVELHHRARGHAGALHPVTEGGHRRLTFGARVGSEELVDEDRVAVGVDQGDRPRASCRARGPIDHRDPGRSSASAISRTSVNDSMRSIRGEAGVEGEHVAFEHPVEQSERGLAVLQDQPAAVGVTAGHLEAELLVEGHRHGEVGDGEREREHAELDGAG